MRRLRGRVCRVTDGAYSVLMGLLSSLLVVLPAVLELPGSRPRESKYPPFKAMKSMVFGIEDLKDWVLRPLGKGSGSLRAHTSLI